MKLQYLKLPFQKLNKTKSKNNTLACAHPQASVSTQLANLGRRTNASRANQESNEWHKIIQRLHEHMRQETYREIVLCQINVELMCVHNNSLPTTRKLTRDHRNSKRLI